MNRRETPSLPKQYRLAGQRDRSPDPRYCRAAAIIRIEQLYPLPEKKLREMLKPFPKNAKFVWCQEEPENMGAWTFIEPRLRTLFCTEIAYAGREASASPAVGALARHKREQARLVADAFSV